MGFSPTQAKRGLEWATRGVSIKHLHRYLSGFEFRFNIRKDGDRFSRTLVWRPTSSLNIEELRLNRSPQGLKPFD